MKTEVAVRTCSLRVAALVVQCIAMVLFYSPMQCCDIDRPTGQSTVA